MVKVIERVKGLQLMDVGSIVIGRVLIVKDSIVIVHLLQAEKNGEKRVISNPFGLLFISNVSKKFIKDLSNEFKIGDIIKAKISNITSYSVELTTSFPELGVIKAFCSKCRKPLHLSGRILKCLSCGSNESRKLSKNYALN
jgi:exosome complex component CSL4